MGGRGGEGAGARANADGDGNHNNTSEISRNPDPLQIKDKMAASLLSSEFRSHRSAWLGSP